MTDQNAGRSGYEPCPNCLASTRVTSWDHWNGFAIQCPRCGVYSGPRWDTRRFKRAAYGAVFLNVLVLPFMARPRRLLAILLGHAALIALLMYLARTQKSGTLELIAMGWLFLGPLVLVAVEHIRHELCLDRKPESAVFRDSV